jgi:hypothetical protein
MYPSGGNLHSAAAVSETTLIINYEVNCLYKSAAVPDLVAIIISIIACCCEVCLYDIIPYLHRIETPHKV